MSQSRIRIRFLSLNNADEQPFSNIVLYLKKLTQVPSSDGFSIQLEEKDLDSSVVLSFNEIYDLSVNDELFQILFLETENEPKPIGDIIFHRNYLLDILSKYSSQGNERYQELFCSAPLDQKYILKYSLQFVRVERIDANIPGCHSVQDHLMMIKQFNQPVYCAICDEFIWGVTDQGYKCKRCSLVTHQKCSQHIPFWCQKSPDPEPCYYTGNGRVENRRVHVFKTCKPSFLPIVKRPCKNCGKRVSKNALQCSICEIIIHKECEMNIPPMCGIVYKALANAFKKNMIQTSETSSDSDPPNENCSDSSSVDLSRPNSLLKEESIHLLKYSDFECIGLLGEGGFSKVYCAQHIPSKKYVAIKVVDGTDESAREQFDVERRLLFRYSDKNPYIINGYGSFHHGSTLFLVMEFVGDDSLKEKISRTRMNENDIRYYLVEIISVIQYLHSNNIVHRDLKLEHILVCSEGHIRLIDYGLARTLNTADEACHTICGTKGYMSPEIRRSLNKDSSEEGYSYPADYWAIGKMFLEMLCNDCLDFDDETNDLLNFIEKVSLPRHISSEARSLARGLLEVDPEKRLGSKRSPHGYIHEHEFFKGQIDWDEVDEGAFKSPNKRPAPMRNDLEASMDLPFLVSSLDRGPFAKRKWTNLEKSTCTPAEEEDFKSYDYINQITWNRYIH